MTRRLGIQPAPTPYRELFWRTWKKRGLTEAQIAERWDKRPRRPGER